MAIRLIEVLRGKLPRGFKRHPSWRKVRSDHLARQPRCMVCSGTAKLEVHHIIPVHIEPEMELDPDNLITLCEAKKYGINCHLLVGHLGDYRKWNVECRMDAYYWYRKIRFFVVALAE